jgi:hypothetical protein
MWLHLNRSKITGPLIPALRDRYDLGNLEAIEAAKLAHKLDFGGSIN